MYGGVFYRGVATGVDIGIYTPKISQSKLFYGVKMTSERLFNSFIHPQKLLYPPKQISGYAPGILQITDMRVS